MNKIIDKKSNVLRICAGNDFSILVQITEYDTETGAWVNYDLSAVSDVHMCLIADNGKRINLPVTVNSNGTVSAPIQAAYLQKTTYGVELTWLNENLNRRTYAPCLLQIVTSTAESTSNIAEYESNDAYHFNIKMEADVAILSIGKISDEYITESELEDELEPYINEDELGIALENYVTNTSLSTTLKDYATKSSLEDYATVSSLDDYVTNTALSSTLDDYATKQYVDDELANIDLSEYYTKSEVDTTLNSYGTSLYSVMSANATSNVKSQHIQLKNSSNNRLSDIAINAFHKNDTQSGWEITPRNEIGLIELSTVETIYNTVDNVNNILSDYITSTSLNSTLSDYATVSDVDELDNRVTILENAPSSVSQEDWDNSNEAIAKELTNNRLEHLSINDKFKDYYTKTQSDARYATASWANSMFVTKSDDVNRQEAIAAAFAYLQTAIDESGGGGSEIDLSSYVTIDEMNNYSEVVSTALTYHMLDIFNINDKFNDYYTMSQSDNKYVTFNYAAQNYVSNNQLDNLSYVVAASLNDLNDRTPSYTSELTNDSGFVTSSSVTTIWQGSQNDYDAITTKDTNTLYIIL